MMDRNEISDLIQDKKKKQVPLAKITKINDTKISINDHTYKLIANYLNQFNLDDFKDKYNPAFNKYDFILGDFSYGQLRLTGFYANDINIHSNMKINLIKDYLSEYCNFGTAYFILHNLEVSFYHPSQSSYKKKPYIKEKITKRRPPIQKRKNLVVKGKGKRKFVIKQKKKRGNK